MSFTVSLIENSNIIGPVKPFQIIISLIVWSHTNQTNKQFLNDFTNTFDYQNVFFYINFNWFDEQNYAKITIVKHSKY